MTESNQLCPEAYLSAISHFTSPPPSCGLSEPSSQALFLTAFATCLVSSAKGEAYAVGFKPPAEMVDSPPTLYTSGSDLDVPLETQNHAKEITGILFNISRSYDESRNSKTEPSPSMDGINTKASNLFRKLHIYTIQYGLAKILKRTDKVTKQQWALRKEECRRHICSVGNENKLEAYESLIQTIGDFRYIVHRSAITADDIFVLLAILEREVEKCVVKEVLSDLDERRGDREFSLKHYISKLLKVYRSTERLVNIAASYKLRILSKKSLSLSGLNRNPDTPVSI